MNFRKGKSFNVKEEWQLYHVFLSMSQDPIFGIGQKSTWHFGIDSMQTNLWEKLRDVHEASKQCAQSGHMY
jgi:hypothetical protein